VRVIYQKYGKWYFEEIKNRYYAARLKNAVNIPVA
jgi:hypothetical protein